MATITLKGSKIETAGSLPPIGSSAPSFTLTGEDLADTNLQDFAGKKVIMNVFPSIDTPVCQNSVRAFHEKAASKDDVEVLCISADLPFAHKRFCGSEEIEGVVNLSEFREHKFGDDYALRITSGPLKGLLSRAVPFKSSIVK